MTADLSVRAYRFAMAALALAALAVAGVVWCATGGHVGPEDVAGTLASARP